MLATQTTEAQRRLDDLTVKHTAANSFADFIAMCQGGYVPTLQPCPCRATDRNIVTRNAEVEELATAVEAQGCKVWRGRNIRPAA